MFATDLEFNLWMQHKAQTRLTFIPFPPILYLLSSRKVDMCIRHYTLFEKSEGV
jgi:hypothetical protein